MKKITKRDYVIKLKKWLCTKIIPCDFCKDMLCISTIKQMLCMPFACQKMYTGV